MNKETIAGIIDSLEQMAATLDQCTADSWADTPEDIAGIYRSIADRLRATQGLGRSPVPVRRHLYTETEIE